jgi:hypothetical protein
VDPRAGLNDVEKILEPTGTRTDPLVVQPVTSRHTDYTLQATNSKDIYGYLNINGCTKMVLRH